MPARDDSADLALLSDAARAAGEIAMRHWQGSPETWEKPGGAGPVTEADLAVDRMLRNELTAARPGHGWLSEETEDSPERLQARQLFIVDPIDGTRAFIAGQDGFAHALAICDGGTVTSAVVYLPARDELYAATLNGPATLNGREIMASARTDPEGARALAPAHALSPDLWKGPAPDLRRSFRTALAWRLCLLAEGRYDLTLSFRPIWEWDMAAGDLIASRAGARVTDATGERMRYNSPTAQATGLIAAAPGLHQALVDRVTWRS